MNIYDWSLWAVLVQSIVPPQVGVDEMKVKLLLEQTFPLHCTGFPPRLEGDVWGGSDAASKSFSLISKNVTLLESFPLVHGTPTKPSPSLWSSCLNTEIFM